MFRSYEDFLFLFTDAPDRGCHVVRGSANGAGRSSRHECSRDERFSNQRSESIDGCRQQSGGADAWSDHAGSHAAGRECEAKFCAF